MKKIISVILCLAYLNSSVLRADAVDDFERQINDSIEQYRKDIEQLLYLERNNIAPSQVKEGTVNAFALTQLGLKQHIDSINSDFKAVTTESENLNSHLAAIKKAASSVTIDGYQDLLSHKSAAQLSIARMRSLHANIENRIKVLKALVKPKDKFCENLSKKLDPDQMRLESPSAIVAKMDLPGYQGIDPQHFYDQSPFARGYALAAGTATFVAAVYIYASINSVTVFTATKTLFAVLYESGGVAVSGTGWGAVIIVAAVVVAYLVGNQIAEHENAEAQNRRDKALKKLVMEIEKIQNHYHETRLTKEEFQSLGLDLCKTEELEKKADGKPGLIFSKNQEWSKLISELDGSAKKLADLSDSLDLTDENLEVLSKQQQEYLRSQIASEVVDGLTKKSLDQEKVANGWLLYNENLKPIWSRFSSFYVSNMNDCFALLIEADLRNSEMAAATTVIKNEVSGTGEINVDLIGQVDKSSQLVSESIKNRLKSCY